MNPFSAGRLEPSQQPRQKAQFMGNHPVSLSLVTIHLPAGQTSFPNGSTFLGISNSHLIARRKSRRKHTQHNTTQHVEDTLPGQPSFPHSPVSRPIQPTHTFQLGCSLLLGALLLCPTCAPLFSLVLPLWLMPGCYHDS